MPRPLVVSLNGSESRFDLKKLQRADLYGRRKRIALDATGKACRRAALTGDGQYLLTSGMTSQGYFTDAGRWVPNSELQGISPDGTLVERKDSTLGVPVSLEEVEATVLLDHQIASTYALDIQTLDPRLASALRDGKLFRFAFNYRSDFHEETGFLVQNDAGIWALVGQPEAAVWLDAAALPPPEEDEDDFEDDLDFEMF